MFCHFSYIRWFTIYPSAATYPGPGRGSNVILAILNSKSLHVFLQNNSWFNCCFVCTVLQKQTKSAARFDSVQKNVRCCHLFLCSEMFQDCVIE